MSNRLKLAAFLGSAGVAFFAASAHANVIVTADNFESYSTGTFTGGGAFTFGGATSATIVSPGSASNQAVEVAGNISSGFGVSGVQWSPSVQPNGANTDTNLADYTLSFDLAFTSAPAAVPGFEAQLFNNGNSSQGLLLGINTSGMSANGEFEHFSIPLNDYEGEPFGKTTLLDPTTQSWSIGLDAIAGGYAESTPVTFDVDNVQVTVVPEPASIGMIGAAGVFLFSRRRRASKYAPTPA